MMSIATALAALDTQRDNLAANLTTKGVTAANTETLSQLVPKVLDITGGEPITKGFVIFDAAADGRPISAAVYGETIYDSMFSGTGYALLSSLQFESEVTTIGASAFYNCTSLELTELPDTITSIGGSAFYGCSKLELTQLPSGVSEIPSSAFRGCTKLCLTSLPDLITGTIGSYAFYSNSALAITSIPIGVTKIDTSAFQSCTGIVNLHIRNGATTYTATMYGSTPFQSCTGLQSVIIGGVGSPVTTLPSIFKYCTQAGLTISVYCTNPATPPTGKPWGATNATVNFLQA